ncbi:Putative metal chaperone YciC [Bacillus sp. THAF10]|uniref:CobW family GTP-binding protein n=1 Tax=Bacillus sp. THAF10 TaxID=2587848 RepID=UPI0012678DB6|nr:GTP-binding protein [Bacillus sp. THAF10]QFT87246.1 Putative metal chaperone YciC [Bacillus sp. THAF10]
MQKKVEIYILAGFLGSGKSTLLKNLLLEEQEKGRKVAVLMNELGEYSVDTGIVGTYVALKELLNGCICCTIKDEVEIELLMLYQQEQPDVIYIEATGVAHPVEILDACLSPVIAPYVDVKSIISLVDSKRWIERSHLNDQLQKLLEEQVRYGDQILLNKTDLISTEEQARIQSEVAEINPRAPQFMTSFADIPLSKLRISRDEIEVTGKEELHVHKHLHIQTMTYQFQSEISKSAFEKWLTALPPTIFRVKGFVQFEGDSHTFLIQYSYGLPYMHKQPVNFPKNLVLIGSNLDKEKLKMDLDVLERWNKGTYS